MTLWSQINDCISEHPILLTTFLLTNTVLVLVLLRQILIPRYRYRYQSLKSGIGVSLGGKETQGKARKVMRSINATTQDSYLVNSRVDSTIHGS